jgi:hypothetical protein
MGPFRSRSRTHSQETERLDDLEAGILDIGIKPVNGDSRSMVEERDPNECGRKIMFWTPICCMLFLCGAYAVGLGLNGVLALLHS